ncbi:hypothetical protein ACHAQA_009351 [Verticillium albo-atrum]
MALLFHAISDLGGFVPLHGQGRLLMSKAFEPAQQAPYLLDQLLALSPLHLSVVNPDTTTIFRQQATAPQTLALGLFKGTEHTATNLQVNFLFASTVGMHVLKDTLTDHMDSLGGFVGAFVEYMHIHSGIRAVIHEQWEDLLRSDLAPILELSQHLGHEDDNEGPETLRMQNHFESTDTSSPHPPPSPTSKPFASCSAYSAIPALHQPKALVVLAYYGALLHQHRDYWIFAGSGATLVRLVAAHVGPFWADALAWPLHAASDAGGSVEGSSVN